MTHTLANMTPAEQQECVGMWAEWIHGAGQMMLVVIEEVNPVRDYTVCVVPGVRYVEPPLSALFPRHDLPRAWTPNGEPVPGEWVESPSAEHFHRWCARWEKKPDEVTP